MRNSAVLLLALVSFASCRKELPPPCGYPLPTHLVSYEIVDAATGQNWFAGAGRTPGDSLRLLASDQGPAYRAVRVGATVRLGPIWVFNNSQSTVTHLLRFSARDVDTVVTTLRFGPVQRGACEDFAPLREVEITYNSRPNSFLRADVPADSLALYERGGRGKLVRLHKQP